MSIDEAFKKFTRRKRTKTGYEIKCTKGLWGVCAPTKAQAENEARHYFRQYYEDGEYS
jgi:hypothetical protein